MCYEVEIKLKVSDYDDVLFISEAIIKKFDKFMRKNNYFIKISNLTEEDILTDLKSRFKKQNNQSVIVKNIYQDLYQLTVISSVDSSGEKGVNNIKSCLVDLISLENS